MGITKIKIFCVSELRLKLSSYELPVLNPHLPKDQQRSVDMLSYCTWVFYTFFAAIYPSNQFLLLYISLCLAITVPKINHACKVTDLLQGFAFHSLHQEELHSVYISNSEVHCLKKHTPNSLGKPMELVDCLYAAALHMLDNAEFTFVVPWAINCIAIKNKLWLLQEAQLPPPLQPIRSKRTIYFSFYASLMAIACV